MGVIYVPPNRNSFWQQINNGTGLAGLAMSQFIKGIMNGVNKRHEAYIDKQVQDRQAAQDRTLMDEAFRLRGENGFTPEVFMQAAMNTNTSLDRLEKLRWMQEEQFKKAADLADAQQRVKLLQGMQEPNSTNSIMATSTIAGRDATNAYNFTHPQLKFDARSAGDRNDYTVFNPVTGERVTTQGQPYGVPAQKIYERTTVPASTVYPQAQINQRKGNGGTGKGKGITDAQRRTAFNAGSSMRYKYANPDELTDAILSLSSNPEMLKAYRDGAFGTSQIFDKRRKRNVDDVTFYKKVPMRLQKAIDPNYGANITPAQPKPQAQAQVKAQPTWKQPAQLSADEQAWVNYVKSNTNTAGMTTAEILALRKKK